MFIIQLLVRGAVPNLNPKPRCAFLLRPFVNGFYEFLPKGNFRNQEPKRQPACSSSWGAIGASRIATSFEVYLMYLIAQYYK